ncbi:MAG: M48 family metalloprotease [Bacteroidetes bacterium]|nr:M48 family metalloprotease [Bacteroidota bacterium]
MRFLLFALAFLISIAGFSQSFGSHPIAVTPQKKDSVTFNDSLFRAYIYERYKEKFKAKDRLDDFADHTCESAKELFNSNQIYKNLVDETNYVNEVFKKTLPREYLSDNLKIHIVRDASINAYCREDGAIFVHVGLLAVIDNEAELAAVLSHEFGHYYLNHDVKRYKKISNAIILNDGFSMMGATGLVPMIITTGKLFGNIRSQEKESDMFTIKFLRQNNYSSAAAIAIEQKFLEYTTNLQKRNGYTKHFAFFNTHPPSQKRINYLKDSLANGFGKGNDFLVDSVFFKNMKQRVIDEVIYLNFFEANLGDCIEKAYLQQLYFPKDEFYIYFIVESLRRKIALFPHSANDYFITSDFNEYELNKHNIQKPVTSSIQSPKISNIIHYNLKNVYGHEFNDSILSAKGYNELLDTSNIEFITNADALKYFTSIAQKTNYKGYTFLKEKTNIKEPEKFKATELEKMLYEQTFLAKENPNARYKNISYPFFLNTYYSSTGGEKSFDRSAITKDTWLYEDFNKKNPISLQDTNFNSDVFIFPELDFRDSYQNATWLDVLSIKVITDNWPEEKTLKKKHIFSDVEKTIKQKIDFESDFPELYAMSKKYNYKKLYFADILENQANVQLGGHRTQFGILIYCVDFSAGTVERFCFKYKPSYMDRVQDNYYNMARSISEVVEKTK